MARCSAVSVHLCYSLRVARPKHNAAAIARLRRCETLSRRHRHEQRKGICVYCGLTGPITRDHVFPRTLFPVLDKNMITVPCCAQCNAAKGNGDHDLRNFVTLDRFGSRHPNAVWHARKMSKAPATSLVNLRSSATHQDVITLLSATGAEIAIALQAPYRMERVIQTVEMMVRGLYFHKFGTRLANECPIEVLPIPSEHFAEFWRRVQQVVVPLARHSKGDGVVWWCSYPVVGDRRTDPPVQIDRQWVICFNESVGFCCGTGNVADFLRKYAELARATQRRDRAYRRLLMPTPVVVSPAQSQVMRTTRF